MYSCGSSKPLIICGVWKSCWCVPAFALNYIQDETPQTAKKDFLLRLKCNTQLYGADLALCRRVRNYSRLVVSKFICSLLAVTNFGF